MRVSAHTYRDSDTMFKIDRINEAYAKCTDCPLHVYRERSCYIVGHDTADVLIVDVQPDRIAEINGIAFAGARANMLRFYLSQHRIDPNRCAFITLVACRPSFGVGDATSSAHKGDIESCRPRVRAVCAALPVSTLVCLHPEVRVQFGVLPAQTTINVGEGKVVNVCSVSSFEDLAAGDATAQLKRKSIADREWKRVAEVVNAKHV